MAQFAIEISVYSKFPKFLFTLCRSARLFVCLFVCCWCFYGFCVVFSFSCFLLLLNYALQMFLFTGHYVACSTTNEMKRSFPPVRAHALESRLSVNDRTIESLFKTAIISSAVHFMGLPSTIPVFFMPYLTLILCVHNSFPQHLSSDALSLSSPLSITKSISVRFFWSILQI